MERCNGATAPPTPTPLPPQPPQPHAHRVGDVQQLPPGQQRGRQAEVGGPRRQRAACEQPGGRPGVRAGGGRVGVAGKQPPQPRPRAAQPRGDVGGERRVQQPQAGGGVVPPREGLPRGARPHRARPRQPRVQRQHVLLQQDTEGVRLAEPRRGAHAAGRPEGALRRAVEGRNEPIVRQAPAPARGRHGGHLTRGRLHAAVPQQRVQAPAAHGPGGARGARVEVEQLAQRVGD